MTAAMLALLAFAPSAQADHGGYHECDKECQEDRFNQGCGEDGVSVACSYDYAEDCSYHLDGSMHCKTGSRDCLVSTAGYCQLHGSASVFRAFQLA